MPNAVLLIAHGSRRQEANDDARSVAAQLQHTGDFACVECCFLELAAPDIATGAARCAASGAPLVLMTPFFLSPGRHVSEHLEAARREAAEKHPALQWLLCEPLGRHPLILDILRDRITQATGRSKSLGS